MNDDIRWWASLRTKGADIVLAAFVLVLVVLVSVVPVGGGAGGGLCAGSVCDGAGDVGIGHLFLLVLGNVGCGWLWW